MILGRDLFLLLWAVIFAAAAIYLIRGAMPKGEGSPFGTKQALSGVMVFGLAGYSAYGLAGNQLDKIMTAIIPPVGSAAHTVIKDDYDGALARASEEKKLVLVNFTGFT